jgi:hypothetical protein
MSISEKKIIAIEKLSKLNSEAAVNEVLEHLQELEKKGETKYINLTEHFDSVNERYGETLKKLAE